MTTRTIRTSTTSIYYTGYFAGLFFDNNDDRAGGTARGRSSRRCIDTTTTTRTRSRATSSASRSPQDKRVRGLLGFFWQEQKHDFWQPFLVEGLADIMLPEPGRQSAVRGHRVSQQHGSQGHRRGHIRQRELRHHGAARADGRHTVLQGRDDREGFFGFGLGFGPGHDAPSDPATSSRTSRAARANGGDGAFSGHWAGLVAQRRVALPVAGGLSGQAVHERRPQGRERRPRRPHQPELQGDRRRAALRDVVGGLPARRHQSQSVRRRLRARLPDELGAGLEDAVGGLGAVQRRSVLPGVGRPAACLPGRERHHAGGQRAERRDHRRRGATACGR